MKTFEAMDILLDHITRSLYYSNGKPGMFDFATGKHDPDDKTTREYLKCVKKAMDILMDMPIFFQDDDIRVRLQEREKLLRIARKIDDKYWLGYIDGKLNAYDTLIPDELSVKIYVDENTKHKNDSKKM